MSINNKGMPWSVSDYENLIDLMIKGASVHSMSAALGRTVSAISTAKSKPAVKARVAAGLAKAAKAIDAPNNGKRWSADDEYRLLKGWSWNHDADLLAKNLGRTKSGVCGKLKELGMLEFDKDEMAFFIPRKLFYKVAA